jgi:threonine dehydratase
MLTLDEIRAARERMRDAVRVSPCAYSYALSEELGCNLYFKLENLQMTGSFKERGACNKLVTLSDSARRAGVIAASAGNHAQGVAYHARRLGIAATIVMPRTTPLVKMASTRQHGAHVILHGAGYDEAQAEAVRLAGERGVELIHPFDDPAIMAGQGTVGLELHEQVPDIDIVVVAVGGGGLSASTAVALKEQNPNIKVYGVEAAAVPSMRAALDAGRPITVPAHETIADGIRVARVGALPLALTQKYLDDIVSVDEEEIAEAILLLVEKEKTVAEGAGAVPLAALRHGRIPATEGKTIALVIGGGNIDVNVLSRIIDRGLAKSGRLAKVRIKLADVPGSLAQVLQILAELGANILQINHDRSAPRLEFGQTAVELVAETRGFEHIEAIERAIIERGFELERSG